MSGNSGASSAVTPFFFMGVILTMEDWSSTEHTYRMEKLRKYFLASKMMSQFHIAMMAFWHSIWCDAAQLVLKLSAKPL